MLLRLQLLLLLCLYLNLYLRKNTLRGTVFNACGVLAWQRIWPRIIVVGQMTDFSLATTLGGRLRLETQGSKTRGNIMRKTMYQNRNQLELKIEPRSVDELEAMAGAYEAQAYRYRSAAGLIQQMLIRTDGASIPRSIDHE